MLQSIFIQNYALIDKLEIAFEHGFSVITGETGAGKSIILGAIGLLLGQRADVKAIRNGANKCIVEAKFNISSYGMEEFFRQNDMEYDNDECIIRREVGINGKSRAFINDTPASLAQMKILGTRNLRVGITTSKKIGNAVKRSRARRVIREALRAVAPEIRTGYDLILVARAKTPFVKSTEIEVALREQLLKAGVLR